MHTDEEKKYRLIPFRAAAWIMLRLINALFRMISHSAEWMKPIPPMSAASWYTTSNPPDTAASQARESRRSSRRKSSAAVGPNSGTLRSAPRTSVLPA